MNDLPGNEAESETRRGADQRHTPDGDCDAQLLGVADIVEAFTALRHDLKTQVRNGRELQEMLTAGLQQIDRRLASQQMRGSVLAAPSGDARPLAEAIAEMEESLQRARTALSQRSQPRREQPSLLDPFDAAIAGASWLARKLSRRLTAATRGVLQQADDEVAESRASYGMACQGLELLHERVKRLMQQCQIERMDVEHEAFDPETMHAIDVVESDSVPSSHVIEQLRPAYRWQGKILRYADVRIAR